MGNSLVRGNGLPSAPSPGAGLTAARAAVPATDMVDSFGINVHYHYNDTLYGQTSTVHDLLTELGIARIRDGAIPSPGSWFIPALAEARARGIKVQLILGQPTGTGRYTNGLSASAVAALKSVASGGYSGAWDSLEGPNEWDLNGGGSWAADLHTWQAEYYSALKADGALSAASFAGPSMGAGNGSYTTYGADSSHMDAGNIHPYPGQMPEISGLDDAITATKVMSASLPIQATETGYHNATATTGGHTPASEAAAADYLVRMLLYYRGIKGIRQTYLYQLLDLWPVSGDRSSPAVGGDRTDPENWFGLVGAEGTYAAGPSSWTIRRKAGFYAVKNLIARLQDTGPGSSTATYGTTAAGGVCVVPITRADGSYDLAVWKAASLYDTGSRTDIAQSEVLVPLYFPVPVNISSYKPADMTPAVTTVASGVTQLAATASTRLALYRVTPA